MTMIKVVTVDDHQVVRAGIHTLLASDPQIKIVGEGWAGEQIEPLLKEHDPDVLLLDISMPYYREKPAAGKDNTFRILPTIIRIRQRFATVKIIIISQYISSTLLHNLIEVDVPGYLLKNDLLTDHIIKAVKQVYQGGRYYSEGVNEYRTPCGQAKIELTTRQQQVLRALAAHPSWTYAQHAEPLAISEHTFSYHLRQLFARLGSKNIADTLVKAAQVGLLEMNDPLLDTAIGQLKE